MEDNEYYIVKSCEYDGRKEFTLFNISSGKELVVGEKVLRIRIADNDISVKNCIVINSEVKIKKSVCYRRKGIARVEKAYIVVIGHVYNHYLSILGNLNGYTKYVTETYNNICRKTKLVKYAKEALSKCIKNTDDVSKLFGSSELEIFKIKNKLNPDIRCEIEKIDSGYTIKGIESDGLGEASIPSGVTEIGELLGGINTLDISDTVERIDDHSFECVDDIFEVNGGENLKEIGNEAFRESAINKFKFNASVDRIGILAFADSELKELDCKADKIDNGAFESSELRRVNIDGSRMIGKFAFSCNYRLKEVNLGNSIESIGKYAFSRCSELNKITIPKSCKYLDKTAFHGCKLKQIIIPKELYENNMDFGKAVVIKY